MFLFEHINKLVLVLMSLGIICLAWVNKIVILLPVSSGLLFQIHAIPLYQSIFLTVLGIAGICEAFRLLFLSR